MNNEFMHTSHSIIYYTQCVEAHCEKAGIININYSFSYPHRILKSILLRMARLYCYDNTTIIAAHSLHSSCHSLEVWEKLPLSVTRGLPPCSPPNMTSPTAPLLPGSDVLSLFPSYDHPSGVLEVLDLLLATR